MNLPTTLTVSRLFLAPVFFILISAPRWFAVQPLPVFIVLVVLFLYMELTDIADGYLARKNNQVTDLGKLLDPFSDVICRVSYFLAFVVSGIMPVLVFLLVLYREFGMVFIRMILSQRGIALAARKGGKLKSLFYFFASVVGLVLTGISWLWHDPGATLMSILNVTALSVFWLSAALAMGSFIDYLIIFFRAVGADKKGTS